MPKALLRLKNLLLYAGLTPGEYNGIRVRVTEVNRKSLMLSCICCVILIGALLLASFFVHAIAKNQPLYAATLAASVALLVLVRVFAGKHERSVLPLFYLFFVLAYGFGIILGVPMQPKTQSTTFCVLLFALPLLIADRPIRVAAFLVAVTAVFSVATHAAKAPEVASLDMVNSISFLALGIVINTFMMNVKFKEALHSAIVERERDTDDLTKLGTKAATANAIQNHLAVQGNTGALLVLDIDNFKGINDTMGHAYGDAVLRIMGECIREAFRTSDVLGRFGGDEFVVFLPQLTDRALIEERVQKLVRTMNERLTSSSDALKVTGSIGIAFCPADAESYDDLFERADAALYDAKGRGKNCYAFYFDRNLK